MRGPDGGSRHDPESKLPAHIWDRPLQAVDAFCEACSLLAKPIQNRLLQTRTNKGSLAWLVCPRCDRGR